MHVVTRSYRPGGEADHLAVAPDGHTLAMNLQRDLVPGRHELSHANLTPAREAKCRARGERVLRDRHRVRWVKQRSHITQANGRCC